MYEFLRNKMLTYEAAPPEDGWDALREKLADEAFFAPLSERLNTYEAAPPPGAWEEIASGLTPVTAMRQKKAYKPLRWLAAAVILGLLLAGSYYFINSIDREENRIAGAPGRLNGPDEERRPAAGVTQSQTGTATPYSSGTDRSSKVTGRSYYNNKPYYNNYYTRKSAGSKKLLAAAMSERPLHSTYIKEATPMDMPPVFISPGKIYGRNGELIQDLSIVNPQNSKYVNITAPNGQRTRVSAKLAIAMPYMGPSESDFEEITGSYYWKQLIQEWQDKILQSGFVPSSANFLDILEFSDLILE